MNTKFEENKFVKNVTGPGSVMAASTAFYENTLSQAMPFKRCEKLHSVRLSTERVTVVGARITTF